MSRVQKHVIFSGLKGMSGNGEGEGVGVINPET